MEQLRAYAVRRIKEEIPREILDHTFFGFNLNQGLQQYVTLDSAIASAILDGSVFMDIMLLVGRETDIDLTGLELSFNIDNTCTVQIPMSRTGGREILECYRVNYRAHTSDYLGSTRQSSSEVSNRLDLISDSYEAIPVTSTTDCEVIAPNVILMNMGHSVPNLISATVNISVDKNMGHIPPKAYHVFGDMVVEKAKQYIYTKQVVKMNRGFIERGAELSIFSDLITGWADAHMNYRDLLKRWRRKEFFFDDTKMKKFVTLITPKMI